ncbi:MAG TPA: DcaP family trimeric outer membrane transporter [Anaeromyxobacter sp.]|nr:DcaP family trimeric outer membrane transporter [Anaeromyxobacter sp.]
MTWFNKLLPSLAVGVALCSAPIARAEEKPTKPQSTEERLDVVEVKQGDAVVKGDIPGSFRIPGSEVSLRLYGFAELNWIHAFNNDNTDEDYATFAPYLPLEDSVQAERGGRDYFTARTSRIGLEAGMPTKYGVMSVKLEGDFSNEPRRGNTSTYGAPQNVYTQLLSNSYGFRLRHAYGKFGGLLVGQTWSTFMDVDNLPETVDFNGPVGSTFIRQPQIRYSYGTLKAGTFTAALENSVTYMLGPDGTLEASASRMPDLVLRWDRGFGFGGLSFRAMTQELRLKSGDLDVTKRGYGVAASGTVKTGAVGFLTFGATAGTGIGRYMYYVEGAAYDAAEDEIVLENAVGGYVGYQLKASDVLRFNFAYGIVYELDSDYTDLAEQEGFDGSDPDLANARYGVNQIVQQAHAGFFYSPVPATDFGLEGIYGARETLSGRKGSEFRLNFLARFYVN